ncbi:MAG: translocation/assembly module TamB, partial [Treponema sp.]|nr:translocation/assembly module TamB [Treponema sp.]
RFGPVPTAVGAGAGTVSAVFRFERWIPGVFDIDIFVPRESPIPFEVNLPGFAAHGDTAGNFRVSMADGELELWGDLWANNAEMSVDVDTLGDSPEEPFSGATTPFILDLTITSGAIVEFFYPSARFPIVRATPEMGTRLDITADSRARQFSIDSDVRIRRGEVFYFQRSFYMRSGVLTFRENEQGFAPLLTARAEVRDRSSEGPVTLSMIVDNAPLTTFTARFESSPPLSQVEIFDILGQTITGGTPIASIEDRDMARALALASTDFLAQFFVVRAIEQQVRNITGLDMFSVRTQALQNAIFLATGFIQPQVDTNRWLGNYFDNTTIFGGKYIGQSMFVQGMLSMRSDAEGGLILQPDLGIEFQGPSVTLINTYDMRIRWDFVPTSLQNWFVDDNSITLTFSRLF